MKEGWDNVKSTKYDWLPNLPNLTHKGQCAFKASRARTLKTAQPGQLRRWA
jgi:hypothetical protein